MSSETKSIPTIQHKEREAFLKQVQQVNKISFGVEGPEQISFESSNPIDNGSSVTTPRQRVMTKGQSDFQELDQSSDRFNTEGRQPEDFMQELHMMRPYEDILQLDLKPTEIFSPNYEQVK